MLYYSFSFGSFIIFVTSRKRSFIEMKCNRKNNQKRQHLQILLRQIFSYFLLFINPITPFTKSFSLQQMKAKKTSSKAVFTTKVQTVLSMWIYFWA